MKTRKFFTVMAVCLGMFISPVAAEEVEEESPFSVGVDVYSSYIWRGTKLGGAAIQPSLSYSIGGFSAGVWGSVGFTGDAAEIDPYISYELPFGLSLGLTDYYYCGDFTETSDTAGSHALEINAAYGIKGFSIKANYILNEAGGAGSAGGDTYFEVGYAFKNFDVFVGAGSGWHTSDTEFALCNIGLGTSKEIKITDSFSLPVSGQIVVNPELKKFYLTVGISL